MAAEKELLRAPVYQRKFRWDEQLESKLIESLFLGLPVPSVFVASNPDGTWELVDGLQRISTLMHFIAEPENILSEISKSEPLRLSELEKLSEFNDLAFADLPGPMQLAFNKRSIRVTALSDKSDRKVRFDMFERLNTGGVALSPQEVRACIYRGKFADFLRELAEQKSFQALLKLQKGKQDDGTSEELVLKFFAYLNNRNDFDGKVEDFLNSYMETAPTKFDYKEGRELFNEVTAKLTEYLGGPFMRTGVHTTPLNQFEAVIVGAADIIRSGKKITKPATGWLDDTELVRASTGATNTRKMLNERIHRAVELLSGTKPQRKK
ncbi:DUF262 domain-containing protein [Corallococcus exiguus]|nr:DUF262 domain-containing protein [Corallococcus exiguus]